MCRIEKIKINFLLLIKTTLSVVVPVQNGLMDKEKQSDHLESGQRPLTVTIPVKLKDDKEVILTAVRISGSALNFASERLKDDKEVVL